MLMPNKGYDSYATLEIPQYHHIPCVYLRALSAILTGHVYGCMLHSFVNRRNRNRYRRAPCPKRERVQGFGLVLDIEWR
jgi:hypothetical protein